MIQLALLLVGLTQGEDPLQGLWKPVDLELKDTPAREALDLLFARAGTRVELPKFADNKVTLSLKGAPFWKAFDDLCRAHGGLRIPAKPSRSRFPWVEPGAWIDFPVVHRGPLRFHVRDVGRVRELVYPRRTDRTDVTLMLAWTPDLSPVPDVPRVPGYLRVTRAEDDRGTSLLPLRDERVEFDYRIDGPVGDHGCSWMFRLGPAAAEAKTLRLEGVWEGAILSGFDVVSFPNPTEDVGKTLKAGPLLVTLARFASRVQANDDLRYEVHVKLGVDPAAPAEWREGVNRVPLERRVLPRVSCGEETGAPIFLFEHKPTETSVPELRGWFRGTPGVMKIRVGRDPRVVKVPFAFDAVRLPEDKP